MWEKSGKYRNELPFELSFLSLFIYSCTSVSYPSLIQSDVPNNTLLLIPIEFGTVFERLKRLEELEIQAGARNNFTQVLVWIPDRSHYNINTTTRQNDTFLRIKVKFSNAILASQKQRACMRNYKLCELFKVCCYWTLSSLGMIESPIGCIPLITKTFGRTRLGFRMIFWRFSCMT